MKKIYTVIIGLLITTSIWAQAPQKMSYQAVIRNNSNALVVSTTIGMKISILQGSISGSAVFVETQKPSTNSNGLASIEIGGGTVITGSFANINWAAGPYFIKTETDPTGGTNYSITGTSQLLSVPFALYSANSGDTTLWRKNNKNTFYSKGNVGIGTASPTSNLEVNGNILLSDRGQKISFLNTDVHIERPIGTDGLWLTANDIYITSKATPIQLQTVSTTNFMDLNGNTKMIVNSQNGNVGIGTIIPARTLHVNAVMRLEPIATAPSSPSKGDMYFDSTLNKLRVYDGSTWQNCW